MALTYSGPTIPYSNGWTLDDAITAAKRGGIVARSRRRDSVLVSPVMSEREGHYRHDHFEIRITFTRNGWNHERTVGYVCPVDGTVSKGWALYSYR